MKNGYPSTKSTNMPLTSEIQDLLAAYSKGHLHDAETKAKDLSGRYPEHPFAWKVLGAIFARTGQLTDALDANLRVVNLDPSDADAYNNLGIVQKDLGLLTDSRISLEKSINLKEDFAEAHSNLGNTWYAMGRYKKAERHHRQALLLKSNFGSAYYNLGRALQAQGRLDKAEASYRQAIALNPNHPSGHNNLGIVLQQQNKLKGAEASYIQAIKLNPKYAEAHRQLALIRKFTSKDTRYQQLRALYSDESLSDDEKCHINFSLATAHEDLEDYESAFQHYLEGNTLRKNKLNYCTENDIKLFSNIKTVFPKLRRYKAHVNNTSTDGFPIFILGMPRSGTTLVEQIISSHSEVLGGGELPFVKEFGFDLAVGNMEINKASVQTFRDLYYAALNNTSTEASIVTDKMPHNFQYIGLISVALPEARIIHVHRKPAAVCWANFKQFFAPTIGLGYSYGLKEVAAFYRLYYDLMSFWCSSLPDKIYNLNYEKLTTNQDEETRRLISHIGLDWEDACLKPERNNRAITTASNIQARQKIYQGSSKKWELYRPYIGSLFDDLPTFE